MTGERPSAGELGYMKSVCVGGPRDGAVFYVTIPPEDEIRIYAKDSNGRVWKCRYRRDPESEGESVPMGKLDYAEGAEPLSAALERALPGARPVRYFPLDEAPPWEQQ